MLAVIETGGKQYIVHQGDKVSVDVIDGKEQDAIVFDHVLLMSEADGSGLLVGKPYVDGKKVDAVILEHTKDKKVRVFKYKPKVRYRRRAGHRQHKTLVEIKKIG